MVPMQKAHAGLRFLLLVLLALAGACGHTYRSGRGGGRAARPPREPAPKDVDWLEDVTIPPYLALLDRATQLEVAEALRDLDHEDFKEFSGGMRRIVAIGEPVVPYLGFAGDERARRNPAEGFAKSCVVILLEPILDEVPSDHIGLHLESTYACVRIAAAEVAGESRQTEHARKLVGLLDDPEIEVRRAAIVSLRQLSNRFFGYRPSDSSRRRREAVDNWRSFWGLE